MSTELNSVPKTAANSALTAFRGGERSHLRNDNSFEEELKSAAGTLVLENRTFEKRVKLLELELKAAKSTIRQREAAIKKFEPTLPTLKTPKIK